MIASKEMALKNATIELPCTADTAQLQKLITDTAQLKKYRMVSGTLNTTLRNGDTLNILVVPLIATRDAHHPESRVALFICAYDMLHFTCQRISSCYGLTHAEASLVTQLFKGMDVAESAQALGITYSTARTYLKQIFTKLKIKRQSELVLRIFTGVLRHLPQDSTLNKFRIKQRDVK